MNYHVFVSSRLLHVLPVARLWKYVSSSSHQERLSVWSLVCESWNSIDLLSALIVKTEILLSCRPRIDTASIFLRFYFVLISYPSVERDYRLGPFWSSTPVSKILARFSSVNIKRLVGRSEHVYRLNISKMMCSHNVIRSVFFSLNLWTAISWIRVIYCCFFPLLSSRIWIQYCPSPSLI